MFSCRASRDHDCGGTGGGGLIHDMRHDMMHVVTHVVTHGRSANDDHDGVEGPRYNELTACESSSMAAL